MTRRTDGKNGTWLEPEEACYPSGAMKRRCRAVNVETGRLQTVRCGIADTYFSIPAEKGGWVGSDDGLFQYHQAKAAKS